jgi:hypothetical protein
LLFKSGQVRTRSYFGLLSLAYLAHTDTPPPADTPAYHAHVQHAHGQLDPQKYIPVATAKNMSKKIKLKMEPFVPKVI